MEFSLPDEYVCTEHEVHTKFLLGMRSDGACFLAIALMLPLVPGRPSNIRSRSHVFVDNWLRGYVTYYMLVYNPHQSVAFVYHHRSALQNKLISPSNLYYQLF